MCVFISANINATVVASFLAVMYHGCSTLNVKTNKQTVNRRVGIQAAILKTPLDFLDASKSFLLQEHFLINGFIPAGQ